MTHVTRRLTAKNRDQPPGTLRSVIEYGPVCIFLFKRSVLLGISKFEGSVRPNGHKIKIKIKLKWSRYAGNFTVRCITFTNAQNIQSYLSTCTFFTWSFVRVLFLLLIFRVQSAFWQLHNRLNKDDDRHNDVLQTEGVGAWSTAASLAL